MARIIIEAFGRAWLFEAQTASLDEPGQGEVTETAPDRDPHSTTGAQVEHGHGADSYTSDVVSRRAFGFSANLHEQNSAPGGI
jgi:hypothetical protein